MNIAVITVLILATVEIAVALGHYYELKYAFGSMWLFIGFANFCYAIGIYE